MKKIQFYNSNAILLHREIPKIDGLIQDTINAKKDESIRIEEVLIKRNTPGVCVIDSISNQLEIRFETGDNRIIKFGADPSIVEGYYFIQALNWDNSVGVIPYDNKTFNILKGNACRLKIKSKLAFKFMSIKLRIAKGILLN